MVNDELRELDAEIRNCVRCTSVLALQQANPPRDCGAVKPRPVLSAATEAPIMLIGQAPGLTEYISGAPFSGDAGAGIRQLISECGLPKTQFDRLVYQTSAVKCFPGRRLNAARRVEDISPSSAMLMNCSDFLLRQIKAVKPLLIVSMGVAALRAADKITKGRSQRTLTSAVGTSEMWGKVKLIYLFHTSPNSRALNDEQNRTKQAIAKALIAAEVRNIVSQGK